MDYKSGFVTIVGRPNVGKSTLLNKLIGEKIAIMSDKPQTTRNTIKAIMTDSDCQVIFIDTPGIHKPKNKLGNYMVNIAKNTLNEVDLILFVIDATNKKPNPGDIYIIEQLSKVKTPIFLVINKIDLIQKDSLFSLITEYKNLLKSEEVLPISALEDEGVPILVNEVKKYLPKGPKYFPDDQLTDVPERFIVAELIREKVLGLMQDEIPYGVGIEVISFNERKNKQIIDISVNIYCEKDSHKGIIIGKEGNILKKIGSLSRVEIENILGSKVFIELWVKVKPDWRNSENILRTLGYYI